MTSVLLKSLTRNLPCRLTDDELRQRGDSLAEVVQELHAEDDRQADVKAQMKARLTELEAKQTRYAIVISRREEYRDVECDLFADTVRGTVDIVRRDTGDTIETRPITEDERQRALPLEAA